MGFTYWVFYMISISDLFINQRVKTVSIYFLENWTEVMFKLRGPYIWESVGVVKLPVGVILNISPFNLILALIITSLVSLNLMLFIYALTLPKVCRIKKNYTGFIGMVLGFFTGFLCCVPTFLIPFASVVSGLIPFVVAIRIYLVPSIILLLMLGAYFTLKRLP